MQLRPIFQRMKKEILWWYKEKIISRKTTNFLRE